MDKAKQGKEELNKHSAVSASDCKRMARRNGWKLRGVVPTNDAILKVDCIFAGKQTSFEDTTYE